MQLMPKIKHCKCRIRTKSTANGHGHNLGRLALLFVGVLFFNTKPKTVFAA